MFGREAWIRRAGVSALVLLSLCVGTIALPHAEGLDDLACSPVVFGNGESDRSIDAASESAGEDAAHCFLCHSLRSFHPAFEKYEQRIGTARAERLHAASVTFADCVDWSLVPGRAPPA
jgi:hypothetical protein